MSGSTVILDIEAITVGKRHREDYGNLDTLRESLERYGQLLPVLVDQTYTLVDGGRRLRAMRAAGFREVLATVREMSEDERRLAEGELDAQHKDWTAEERSRWRVKMAAEIAPRMFEKRSSESDERPKGHPEMTYGVPKDDIAKAIGISKGALILAEAHVRAVEQFPELKEESQDKALKMARKRRKQVAMDAKARELNDAVERWKDVDTIHKAIDYLNKATMVGATEYVEGLRGLEAIRTYLETDLRISERSMDWLREYAEALRKRLGVAPEGIRRIG